jgi:predicted nucleic acid-binding protein
MHADIYLSALVIGEIRQGIERIRPRDETQAAALARWLKVLLATYRDRILPVTTEIAEEWGRISPAAQPLPVIDGLMAATAKVHGLVFVTRNVEDVSRADLRVLNPFVAYSGS